MPALQRFAFGNGSDGALLRHVAAPVGLGDWWRSFDPWSALAAVTSVMRGADACAKRSIGQFRGGPVMTTRIALGLLTAVSVLFTLMIVPPARADHDTIPGFDQYGYNYKAKVFVGLADGVARALDNTVWGNPTYAFDHLVMKWSKAWDDARFHGGAWTPQAWTDNEWNGKVPNGSGETWHYKIQWVGSCGQDGTPLPDGGYCIWGQFEVIMDQGVSDTNYCNPNQGGHQFCGLAIPNGFGP
jgi:hypothetical protein